uniref:Uncharacterized protein n=1 Tax=Lepeophtheirus salmonis TaxID=72036 RepID=A0A0K2ULS1_LEPSM
MGSWINPCLNISRWNAILFMKYVFNILKNTPLTVEWRNNSVHSNIRVAHTKNTIKLGSNKRHTRLTHGLSKCLRPDFHFTHRYGI